MTRRRSGNGGGDDWTNGRLEPRFVPVSINSGVAVTIVQLPLDCFAVSGDLCDSSLKVVSASTFSGASLITTGLARWLKPLTGG